MTIQLVTGSGPVTATGTSSVTPSYNGAGSTAGNLLIAVVFGRRANVGTPSITAPNSSWVSAEAVAFNSYGETAVFYYPSNPGGITSTGAWTITGAIPEMAIIIAEYSGIAASPLDQVSSNSGAASTSLDSGTTSTTTQASELIIAGFGQIATGDSFSTPTNGFTIEASVAGTSAAACYADKIVSSTGAQDCGVTSGISAVWGGVIATFKASGGGSNTFDDDPPAPVQVQAPAQWNPDVVANDETAGGSNTFDDDPPAPVQVQRLHSGTPTLSPTTRSSSPPRTSPGSTRPPIRSPSYSKPSALTGTPSLSSTSTTRAAG